MAKIQSLLGWLQEEGSTNSCIQLEQATLDFKTIMGNMHQITRSQFLKIHSIILTIDACY